MAGADDRELRDGELRDIVTRRLRAQDQRLTTGREDLLEVLVAADRPVTIPEILEERRDLKQSSVYRNLVVMEQAGVVRRLVTHDEFTRYELAEDLTGHHHHLVCSNCGRIDDLPPTPGLERSVAAAVAAAAEAGFRTDHHRFDLVGLCARCV